MAEQLTTNEQLLQRMADLKHMLTVNDPRLGMELTRIHANLIGSPELLHVLDDAALNTIVNAQSRISQIEIVTASAKKNANKTATGKSLKSVSLEDI